MTTGKHINSVTSRRRLLVVSGSLAAALSLPKDTFAATTVITQFVTT
jgi:hypothetical protein